MIPANKSGDLWERYSQEDEDERGGVEQRPGAHQGRPDAPDADHSSLVRALLDLAVLVRSQGLGTTGRLVERSTGCTQ